MAAPTFPDILPSRSSPGNEVSFRVSEAVFGDGYVQSVPDGINTQIDRWNLIWENYDDTDVDEIIIFLNDLRGSSPFFWTPPKGGIGNVLWVCKGYSRNSLNYTSSTLTAIFERWFGSESA